MPKVLNAKDTWWDGDGYSSNRTAPNSVYVGRPSKWGNPYRIGHNPSEAARLVAVEGYREYISRAYSKSDIRDTLKGKDLVCWCAPKACHADVLLEIANGED